MIEQHENNFFLVHQGEKHKLKVGDLLTVPWGKTGQKSPVAYQTRIMKKQSLVLGSLLTGVFWLIAITWEH